MKERSLEEIVGEVRQLTGGLASARLVGAEGHSPDPDPERMRMRAARLIEEALGGDIRDALSRIENEHRKNLNDLWNDQATVLSRLCDEIEQALQHRQQDERALQQQIIEVTLAAVERRLMPEIEELRLMLQRQQAEPSQASEKPRLLSPTAVMWLIGLAIASIGGALFAPELGRVLEAALSLLG